MLVEAKFVSLELQYIDGSKIEAGDRSNRKPCLGRSNMTITSRGSVIEESD